MKNEKNHNHSLDSTLYYFNRLLLKSKSWLQANSWYGWLPLILICLSFVEKNKKVRTCEITKVTKQGAFLNPISEWRELSIQDTVNILQKDSIHTYVFICSGNKYAESVIIKSKKVEVGDKIHVIK